MKTFLQIALRNLWKNRRRSFFTAAAIAFGFAALNVLGGFTAYMFEGLSEAYIYAMSNGHLIIFKRGHLDEGKARPRDYLLPEDDIARIRALCATLPEVLLATPQLNIHGMLSNGKASTVFIAAGRDSADTLAIRRHARGFIGRIKTIDGDELDDAIPDGIGIASGLAAILNLTNGAEAVAMTTTIDGRMNAHDVRVLHTFKPMQELRDTLATMPLQLARDLYDTPAAGQVKLLLRRDVDPHAFRPGLAAQLKAAGLNIEIKTWDELHPTYKDTRDMFAIIFLFVTLIVLAIVGLSVVNTINMAVIERTREIGTLRALGLKRRGVILLFTIESLLLALIGCAAGMLLTLAAGLLVDLLQPAWSPPGFSRTVPIHLRLQPHDILPNLAGMILLALLVTIRPARRAARLKPVDALSHV